MADKRNRHGQRALMVAIKTRDLRALDRRCVGFKALMEWKSELVTALGGPENVSPQKMSLLDLIVRSKLYLDNLDAWLLTQRSLVNGRKRAVLPALMQRQTLVDGLARLLSQIGLERQARPVPKLDEFIADFDRQKAKEQA